MMTDEPRSIIEEALSWPDEDQRELAEYARMIEARRTGVYRLTAEERAAIEEGLAQADRGEFVPDDVIAEADKRYRS